MTLVAVTNRAAPDRHTRILDAAERVFVRAGFHAATMADVATEAGMSPGNIYRYFASKNAIIAALAERDRTEIAADFADLDARNGTLFTQLEALARRHMLEEPREKAILALQIWAEAARDPDMATMCAAIDGTVLAGIAAGISAAKANGELPADLDEARYVQALFLMVDGIFCRRAIDPEFDAAGAIAILFTAMRAFAQAFSPSATEAALS